MLYINGLVYTIILMKYMTDGKTSFYSQVTELVDVQRWCWNEPSSYDEKLYRFESCPDYRTYCSIKNVVRAAGRWTNSYATSRTGLRNNSRKRKKYRQLERQQFDQVA